MFVKILTFSAVIISFALTGVTAGELCWHRATKHGAASLHAPTTEVFTDEVAKVTNGKLKINAHHTASLDYKSLDQFDAAYDGALQLPSQRFLSAMPKR